MKRNFAMAVATMALVIAVAAPSFGQYSGRMLVNVPFSFVVENERFQPGDYVLEKIANGRLRISSKDGQISTSILVLPKVGETTYEKSHFIFRRYGAENFLSMIWVPGQNTGWEVFQGKLEHELAKKKAPVETATLIGR